MGESVEREIQGRGGRLGQAGGCSRGGGVTFRN